MKFNEACGEIVAECEKAPTIPDALLSDMLAEVMDYCQTLQLYSRQRRGLVDSIVQMEKQNLEEFRKLHDSSQVRKVAWTALTTTGGGAVGAGAAVMMAGGPVGLAAAALLGMTAGLKLSESHRAAANRLQQSLMEDMRAKNVPIQCLGYQRKRHRLLKLFMLRLARS